MSNAFRPKGPLLSFTGANAAPTSVQVIALEATTYQDVVVTNTDVANDCVIGWGLTDALAKTNAAAGVTVNRCYYLLARSQVVIRVSSGDYMSGITPGSGVTAVIKVQAGDGE